MSISNIVKGLFGFFAFLLIPYTSTFQAIPLAASLSAASGISVTSQFDVFSKNLYKDCQLSKKQLSYEIFKQALVGYYNMLESGKVVAQKGSTLSIVDFTKPSSRKRLHVIDLKKRKVLHYTYVSHGRNTGDLYASKFSNTHQSLQSSLGFYKTAETYYGKHGYSLKLDGLERGFNSNARARAVVMHGADYVSADYVRREGRLGRSWGCPAVPREEARPIINQVKGGNCLFIYKNDRNYLQKSKFLNETIAARFFANNLYLFAQSL